MLSDNARPTHFTREEQNSVACFISYLKNCVPNKWTTEIIKNLEDLFNPIAPIAPDATEPVPDIETILDAQQLLDGFVSVKAGDLRVHFPIVDYPVTSSSGNEKKNNSATLRVHSQGLR